MPKDPQTEYSETKKQSKHSAGRSQSLSLCNAIAVGANEMQSKTLRVAPIGMDLDFVEIETEPTATPKSKFDLSPTTDKPKFTNFITES